MTARPLPCGEVDAGVHRLLSHVYERWGHDFREYAPGILQRRVRPLLASDTRGAGPGLSHHQVMRALSINVTTMFRDPIFYQVVRTHVVTLLGAHPFVRIWHAGCSTGEEVYSMAILLHEEGLADRCLLYATDMNDSVLARARRGVYPVDALSHFAGNYQAAGGRGIFSTYYTARFGFALLDPSLRANVVFARHNLVHDGPFHEFDLILCRNVLIFFSYALQVRVHDMLHDSLTPGGMLGLGQREALTGFPSEDSYRRLDPRTSLYRRIE